MSGKRVIKAILCPQCLGVGFKDDKFEIGVLHGCDLCGGSGAGKKGGVILPDRPPLVLGSGRALIKDVLTLYKLPREVDLDQA